MLFKNDTHELSTTKKYLDAAGLGHLSSLIVSFVRNYAAVKTHNHDGVYAKSSHAHTTAQVTGLDSALAGKASSTHNHSIGQVTNLQSSLDGKVPTGRLINKKALSKDIILTPSDIGADAQGSAAAALDSAKAYTDTVAKTKAQLSHTHTIAQVTDLQASLDSKQPKGSYAPMNHAHDASNITSGTVSSDRLPIIPQKNGGTGHDNFSDAVNDMMSKIAITGATPSDGDYVIGQVANGGVIHRKTMSSIWTWIKSKCDAVYQAKGSYAAASHTHNASEITNLFDYIKNKTIGSDIPNLPSDADLNNYKTPGVYCHPSNGGSIKNSPYGSEQAFRLVVFCSLGSNSPYIGQRVNGYSGNHISYTRYYDPWNGSGGSWGNWHTNSTSSGSGSGSSGGVNIGKIMYPVGAVYISYSSMSPANMFGGSWVAITGRFPILMRELVLAEQIQLAIATI